MESRNKHDKAPEIDVAPENNLGKSQKELLRLIKQLSGIREEMLCFSGQLKDSIGDLDPAYKESAKNLLHYLAFRRHDLRALQSELAELGLSSLGRSESHVLATIDAVLLTLSRLADPPVQITGGDTDRLDFKSARQLLDEHTKTLLGPAPEGRNVHIMVTMPSEAANDYGLVLGLLNNGMDCMRINCAHDDREEWSRMIGNLRRAKEETGKPCMVIMDIPGPKLRTGPVCPGPSVIKYRPQRDAYGNVIKPANILLAAEGTEHTFSTAYGAVLPVPEEWLRELSIGDEIRFVDGRGARRSMTITEQTEGGFRAEAVKTAYVTPDTLLRLRKYGKSRKHGVKVCSFAPGENHITLREGDTITLTRDLTPGRPALYDDTGNRISPAAIGCTITEILDDVKAGEPVWFDDGKIGGVAEGSNAEGIQVRITHTSSAAARLSSDKGINLPGSKLDLPALTPNDIPILEFIAENADIAALSFANTPEDIKSLLDHLRRMGRERLPIVLKIETRRGFENLPAMLLEAMKSPGCGVMIARGDLAVELGFERLAEVQEEILWLCEAAHVPVIWATQVLESLAKQGSPTRAEITDAAMGHRAECVMLNKGPHILEALKALDNILRRMETHQFKKMSMLRELRLAYNFPHE
ncbi:MAG TPA: pyruvate kinase [Thermodesulfobacteriota bacterium]|nr:pyruvate kinase [Thermodesulfobacteriota bacterium]